MSDKYLRRTTILFKRGERFDEELLEMLGEITPSNNFSPKIKELAHEYLKMTKPKVYEEVVERLNKIERDDPVDEEVEKKIKTSKKEDKNTKTAAGLLKYN